MNIRPPSIGLYVSAMGALAALMLLQADWVITGELLSGAATVLLIAVVSEAGSVRLKISTATSSIAFIPYLAAIVLVGPALAMVVSGLTMSVSGFLFKRKPFVKVAFNTSKEIIAVGASGHLYVLLGGIPSLHVFAPSIPAFVAAALVFFPLDQGPTAVAIALSTRTRLREAWGRLSAGHQLFDLGASSVSLLLAFLYIQLDLWGPLLVVVPLLLVRHNYGLILQFEQVNRDLLVLMVKSIEARDPYTSGHSVRVSRFARTIAEELRLSAKQIDQVATAALLHDVGKIYQEFAPILRKEGKLEPKEVRLMQSHPVKGADLIGNVSSLRGEVQDAVRYHHEAFGGRGYPDRLSGQEIPLAARIITVVDTFDAMTTTRPYRAALSRQEAFAELYAMVGRQFDPKLVDLFCTSGRVASVIDEALRERPASPAREVGLATGEITGDENPEDISGALPRRRWLLRASMEHQVPDTSERNDEKNIA
jgi:putative nucleotidyltransferase with HDIG domain